MNVVCLIIISVPVGWIGRSGVVEGQPARSMRMSPDTDRSRIRTDRR